MVKAFIKAARLRTLPLSLSGVILGSFLALAAGYFNWIICVFALLTTTGFQVLSNFANDYGDGVKGTDNLDRIGPERAIQSGEISASKMLFAIKATAIITFIIALILIYLSFYKTHLNYFFLFLFFGLASIVAALKYTMGSKAYGYRGYGDIFVFLFFGWLSVLGSYFLYTKNFDWTIILPATAIGMLSVGVLNLNNMRDRASDIKANKRTLVVKIGMEFAKYYHYYLLFSAFLLSLLYVLLRNNQSNYQFLFLIAFLPIFNHLYLVYKNQDPKKFDPELKKLALSTFLFAILFGLGQYL